MSPINLGGRMFVALQNGVDISDRFIIDGTPEPAPYTEEYRVPARTQWATASITFQQRTYHGIPKALDWMGEHSPKLRAWIDLHYRLGGQKARLEPSAYRTLYGRSHPRVRRMHTAYSRRRGRGRW